VWWAEHEFRLQRRQPEGGTLRDAFKAYRRMKHRPHPDEREPVRKPEAVFYLYRWFQEIARGRPVGGMGVFMPIPPSEILAWATLRRITLQGWEMEAVMALDGAFLASVAEEK
jgi:hypothetical protein